VQLWEQGIGRLDQPATSPEAALLQTLSAEDDLAEAVLRANAGERITRDQEQRLLALAGMLDREALRRHALAQEALWQERQRIVRSLQTATEVERPELERALAENGTRGRVLAAAVRMLPLRWRDMLRAGGELPPPADDETTTEGSGG
jgi:hypothetical protein